MEIERSGEQQSDLDERVTKTQNTDNNHHNRQNRFDVAVIQRLQLCEILSVRLGYGINLERATDQPFHSLLTDLKKD